MTLPRDNSTYKEESTVLWAQCYTIKLSTFVYLSLCCARLAVFSQGDHKAFSVSAKLKNKCLKWQMCQDKRELLEEDAGSRATRKHVLILVGTHSQCSQCGVIDFSK